MFIGALAGLGLIGIAAVGGMWPRRSSASMTVDLIIYGSLAAGILLLLICGPAAYEEVKAAGGLFSKLLSPGQ